MKSCKAISTWGMQLLGGFTGILIIILLIFLLFGRFFDIRAIVISSEIDRRASNIAHVLLSYHKLVYEESGRYHRGVFDKIKLDEKLPLMTTEDIGYPDAKIDVEIEDLETGAKWSQTFGSSSGSITTKIFPIRIKDGEDYHIGKMSITLTEPV